MLLRVVLLVLLFQAGHAVAVPTWPPPAEDREQYRNAVEAINRGRWTQYQHLRPGLENYPLAIYLDYFELSRKPRQVRPGDARLFLQRSEGSPLPNRFLGVYLMQAGRDARWQDFLTVMPNEPNSIELKCYYFRARLASGDQLAAWEGAGRLWVHGESRPKACDPLFDAWLKADQLSDEVVWARLLKAFDARQRSLMSYVAGKGSSRLRPWSDKLLAVYAQPDRIRALAPPADNPRAADIAAHGIAYLTRYRPEPALREWLYYQQQMKFGPQQAALVENAIALRSLFAKSAANKAWVDDALARLGDDKLVEIRARWALREQDWPGLAQALSKLSPEGQQDSAWRYWRAVTHERGGEPQLARALFEVLARERDYYGFLAAERLGLKPSFNHRAVALEDDTAQPLREHPVVRRIAELFHHDQEQLAHSEWYQVLQNTGTEEQQALAALAATLGWHRMAIDAANQARDWDALDLRFPMPYRDTFSRQASLLNVPSSELMAIARRESAFFAGARSPVGARGLMQVMPATGRQVASRLGAQHSDSALFDVEHNVRLGSAYYRQLLDRYGGNRVLAMTAYNAGPRRVDRWRNKPAEVVPVDVWIETIPFRETRNYVKAVLAYNLVFKYLMGEEGSLLTAQERQLGY
ncbi:transglycosylase SLT domain-containing protein [Kineobactrum salinum]|uniref:Transglycosylase SLT domain-containing protein n=1 Tax=Kineobactrum salinum TaxID=2708301 RepID=A0A6C0U549_9GAMM|nr:transglycosylase SLT domain-containing protein [Kineobactrum salinum]QIB67241.1 transglycosylase SLT domain-containing protein [Kineobactrum salinum]